uniref:Uncharacterized protein n=1 Tax=Medicago truncatula TaxID=3880 RepID=I3SL78_MEDTR|nr:unknown [Medicago truncatula]
MVHGSLGEDWKRGANAVALMVLVTGLNLCRTPTVA